MKQMLFAAFIVVIVILTSGSAYAQEYTRAPAMIADVLIARPVGLAFIVVGTAAFIVALPFAIPSGSVKPVAQALVVSPFEFTFKRPVGEISVPEQ